MRISLLEHIHAHRLSTQYEAVHDSSSQGACAPLSTVLCSNDTHTPHNEQPQMDLVLETGYAVPLSVACSSSAAVPAHPARNQQTHPACELPQSMGCRLLLQQARAPSIPPIAHPYVCSAGSGRAIYSCQDRSQGRYAAEEAARPVRPWGASPARMSSADMAEPGDMGADTTLSISSSLPRIMASRSRLLILSASSSSPCAAWHMVSLHWCLPLWGHQGEVAVRLPST